MLGKLMKHEWKSTYRIGCVILGAMAVVTLIGWLAFHTPMWKALDNGSFTFGWMDIFSILTLVMYVIMLAGANLCILIYLGVHFYRTMYTDEGYLTHTLPVTKMQILGSKVLVSGLWMMIVLAAMYLSMVFLVFTMVSLFAGEGYSLAGVWQGFMEDVSWLLHSMHEDLGLNIAHWVVVMLLNLVVGPFASVVTLFGAISMGQLFTKHRVLMAVVSYIGIMIVNQMISSLLRSIWTAVGYYSFGNYLNSSMDVGTFIDILLAVVLYFVSYYVINSKLNME